MKRKISVLFKNVYMLHLVSYSQSIFQVKMGKYMNSRIIYIKVYDVGSTRNC